MWSRFVMSQVKHNSYFLCGVALGLWVSLAMIPLDEEPVACAVASSPAPDEFAPQREERPLGPAGQAAGRSVQRPRYYSTELGMRGSLLSGVLSSEDALKTQVAALNRTMARLQPALKFFITASAMSSVPGLANVVGFTDTREMLKPFHALKYLADNYLEEYDFFFLVSDGAFVNARRLSELVSRLSVSQDVYMGNIAEDDSHYCSLESGIILSNSVLRAVHNELDWCVRNSYSAHHHENLGRCVAHAAHLSCSTSHQGESYLSVRLEESLDADSLPLRPELADCVTARPAPPAAMHRLHAYVSRVQLERARSEALKLRVDMWQLAPRHPPHYRNATWPAGLRADPGLASPRPDTKFDHLRWTLFNASHAFMPDEHRAVSALTAPTQHAVELVMSSVRAWALQRWTWARGVELVEGAWQWDPPAALRYRLLLRLSAPDDAAALRLVEVARPLGGARLVPVRYVTESARVWLVLPVPLTTLGAGDAAAFLQRYRTLTAQHDSNTNLYVVAFHTPEGNSSTTTASALLAPLQEGIGALVTQHHATAELVEAREVLDGAGADEAALYARAGHCAVRELGARLPADALVLIVVPHLEFNQDFLNRVRMNTIRGAQWFAPMPFAHHALHAHPLRRAARSHTGRFNVHAHALAAFYRSDLDAAEAEWRGAESAGACALLARGSLRAVRAPEPGAVLPPRPRPLAHPSAPALRALDLGAANALAQLLLEMQHEEQHD